MVTHARLYGYNEIIFVQNKNVGSKDRWEIFDNTRSNLWRLQYGPMRRVFDHDFLVVIGTSNVENYESNVEAATFISNSHFAAQHTRVMIVHDVDLKHHDAIKYNLILIGGQYENKWTVHVMEEGRKEGNSFPPIINEYDYMMIGKKCTYNTSSVNSAILVPWYGHPDASKLALIVSGNAKHLHELIATMSFSSNVPLTRAIFTNMLPDYIVTSKDFLWKGLGGLNAAGYWDSKWNYDDRVGFCHREM